MAASNLNLGKASGGVLNIQPADGVTNTSIVLPTSGTVATIDSVVGFKNYIINGGFTVWQRGFVINNVGVDSYTADMWVHTRNGSGATVNIQQGSWLPGSTETGVGFTSHGILEFIQTAAGTGCSFNTINHRIESVQWSSEKILTLSFNCEFLSAADILPMIIVRQNFGVGGSASVGTVIATNIPVSSNSWNKKSFTFALPSISGKTVGTSPYTEIIIFLPVNKVQHFRLNKVQLESGSVVTPFESRPQELEESLCQRYFQRVRQRIIESRAAGEYASSSTTLPVTMRVSPSYILTTTYSSVNVASNIVAVAGSSNFSRQCTATSAGVIDSDLEYSLSAEL